MCFDKIKLNNLKKINITHISDSITLKRPLKHRELKTIVEVLVEGG